MPGQWLEVDLGATELVARVDLLAIDWQDLPAGFPIAPARRPPARARDGP